MSKGTLYVRFPDGEIRYGIYNGTTGDAWSRLFATVDEAWDAEDSDTIDWWPDPAGAVVPVEVATDYGAGSRWTGTAGRNSLEDGRDPHEDGGVRMRGLPAWTNGSAQSESEIGIPPGQTL